MSNHTTYAFGSGSMLDALGLAYAAEEMSLRHVSYTGIDLVEWSSRLAVSIENHCIQCDIKDFWHGIDLFDGNILLFPKILSEIPEGSGVMESFCEGLAKTPFASDTVLLCTSYRNVASMKKGSQETDWYKMEKVIAALIKKGYRCEPFGLASMESRNPWLRIEEIQAEDDTPYPYCFLRDEYGDLPIQDIAPDFVPEDSIVEFLNSPGTIRRT